MNIRRCTKSIITALLAMVLCLTGFLPLFGMQTVRAEEKEAKIWFKDKGAAGYQVYRSMRKNGKYVCVKKNLKAAKYTDKKLKKGKTYYYKVRAYKKVNGKTITGAYSAIRKVKVK